MKDDTVRSLERGLTLLQCFDLDTEELSLAQLTERLSLAPSTTLRLASALTRLGFLEKSKAKTYSLGNKVYLLGAVAQKHFKLRRIVQPPMLALRDDTKEAVSLYALEGEYRVCYEHVESLLSMRCVVRVGDRFPLWAGAGGKCLLAFADKDIVERELAKAEALTATTIVDADQFRTELARIRDAEEAVSYGEREEGVVSIAVPIFSGRNRVDYALSLAAPASRVDETLLRELIARIKEAARVISRQLYS